MKKALVVLSSALIAATLIPRPALAAPDFDFGVKAGMSLSRISYSGAWTSEGLNNLASPVFGGFFAINLGPAFSIQPEVYYLKQGNVRTQMVGDVELRTEQIFTYIDVPVLAKVRFMAGGKLRPVVFAGPAVSFLTTAVQRFFEDGAQGDEFDIQPFFKSTNFSAVFGAGLEYSVKKIVLVFDVRYDLGFVDVETEADDVDAKTRAFLVMLGIGF